VECVGGVLGASGRGARNSGALPRVEVLGVNHLDTVREALGPKGFQSWVRGNAMMALMACEDSEAAKWTRLLAEGGAPTEVRVSARSSKGLRSRKLPEGSLRFDETDAFPVGAPDTGGAFWGPGGCADLVARERCKAAYSPADDCRCIKPVGHEGCHGDGEGEDAQAWCAKVPACPDRDGACPAEERCGATVRPLEASLFAHQCELPPGHEGEHRLVGRDRDEPADEELLAALENTDRQPSDEQWRLIADRLEVLKFAQSELRYIRNHTIVSPEWQKSLAHSWRAKL